MPFSANQHETVSSALAAWLAAGGHTIGEIRISHTNGTYQLHHEAETTRDGLKSYHKPVEAREIAKYDAKGEFRPVKTAPTLIKGWQMELANLSELQLALEFFYPAALGVTLRLHKGELSATPLKEFFGRQTGMYRVTGLAQHEETCDVAAQACSDANCRRKCLWRWSQEEPLGAFDEEKSTPAKDIAAHWPIYCIEPCPALVGAVRGTVKKRLAPAAQTNPAPASHEH
jgi:sirohydrochlorin cobaltochelatase